MHLEVHLEVNPRVHLGMSDRPKKGRTEYGKVSGSASKCASGKVHLGLYLRRHLEVCPGVHPVPHLELHLEVHLGMHPRVHLEVYPARVHPANYYSHLQLLTENDLRKYENRIWFRLPLGVSGHKECIDLLMFWLAATPYTRRLPRGVREVTA